MPKAALTSEGDGKAVAPEADDLVPRRADLLIEYIAGAAQSFDAYARSLPPWQDLLTRDFPDVYERMLLDPVVHASTRVIKLNVLADDITPRPAVDDQDDPDYQQAKEFADFCADAQGGMKRALEDVWMEQLDAVFVGHRLSEKVIRTQDSGPHSGKSVWDRVNPKPQDNYRFVLDPFGNLVGIVTRPPGGDWGPLGSGLVGRDNPNLLPREKFALLTWDPRNGDPRGRALLRHCYEPWWHKQQALAQWLKFLAQTAVPSLFATTPQGAGVLPPQDALGNPTGAQALSPGQQLLNQLVAFQGGTAMVAAAGTLLQVIQAAGDGSVFSRRIDYADSCIAREITLQTLAIIEAKHGTRSQGEVHQDVMDLGVDYIRRLSCRVIREDVYRPLIRYNWGDDAADRLCPYASMTAVAKQDLNTTLPAYASVGYQLAPDQLPAVDEELGLPVRKEQPPEQQQPPPGDGNPPGNPPDGNQPPGGADSQLSKSTVPPEVPFADADGRWVTTDEGRHVFIRGGQVLPTREAITGAGAGGGVGAAPASPEEDYRQNGTRARAFKAWFGDWEKDPANASKVVNPRTGEPQETHGEEPKVVYHGRQATFESFDLSRAKSVAAGLGAYFAEDRRIADTFATMGGKKGDVLTAYLSIKKPFNFDAPIPAAEVESWSRVTKEMPGTGPKYFTATVRAYQRRDGNPDGTMPGHVAWRALKDAVGDQQANKVLERLGYDGIVHTSSDEAGAPRIKTDEPDFGRVWVAFRPTQIKAVDNAGTFDPSDPRVAFGLSESTVPDGSAPFYRPEQEREPARLSISTVPPVQFAPPDFPLPRDELSGLSREELLSLLADAALQSRLSMPAGGAADAPFYSPDQMRDEQGRWTSGGGGLSPAEHEGNRSAAADAVRAFARGTTRPTEDEVRAVAGHLSRLTVAQLHALKAEHGLKASAPDKAALVQKLALRFTSHRQNNQQEGLTTPQKESKIPVGSETRQPQEKAMTTAELPKLRGTEKQVEYASQIRAKALEPLTGEDAGDYLDDAGVAPEHHRAVQDWLREQSSAGWWLDRKNQDYFGLVKEALRAVNPPAPVREAQSAGYDVRFVASYTGRPYVRQVSGKAPEVLVDADFAARNPALAGKVGQWVPAPRGLVGSFESLPRVGGGRR